MAHLSKLKQQLWIITARGSLFGNVYDFNFVSFWKYALNKVYIYNYSTFTSPYPEVLFQKFHSETQAPWIAFYCSRFCHISNFSFAEMHGVAFVSVSISIKCVALMHKHSQMFYTGECEIYPHFSVTASTHSKHQTPASNASIKSQHQKPRDYSRELPYAKARHWCS